MAFFKRKKETIKPENIIFCKFGHQLSKWDLLNNKCAICEIKNKREQKIKSNAADRH